MSTAQLNEALSSNYLLAEISFRSWSGTKTDKEASQEVIAAKNAVKGAGRFVKDLMAGAAAELEEVRAISNEMRNYVIERTLPWSTNEEGVKRGGRLLASAVAMTFLQGLEEIKARRDIAILNLARVWPQRVQQALINLGTLADATQYPNAVDIPALFSVNVSIVPLPSVQDFSRLNVPAALADALGQRHQQHAEVQVKVAMDTLRERFTDELERFERQMSKHSSGEKTKLYASLVSNMEGLVNLARSMNITGNPRLAQLADRIESKLLQFPIETYKNDTVRAAVAAADAKELLAQAAVDDVFSQI